MLAIAFRFPGGGYHATPWGRHVNEADVEWPPSPWRIVRALIAVWHRKAERENHSPDLLERLLGRLAEGLPLYRLPRAVHTHLRHYMPVREGSKDKNTLIFDAFARVSAEDALVACWPGIELAKDETGLLDELLAKLGHLGRAESWVEAGRLPGWEGRPNCVPVTDDAGAPHDDAGESISLPCPLSPSAYGDVRERLANAGETAKKKGRRRTSGLGGALPGSWLEALSVETADLRASGWSQPPALQMAWYTRPADALPPAAREPATRVRRPAPPVTTVRFALYGRPLPMLEDAVRMGEVLRMALMRSVERDGGEISPLLSGHDLPRDNRHEHAFFLPEAARDGRIHHLLLHVPGGVDPATLRAAQKLKKLYIRGGSEWEVWVEGAGVAGDFEGVSSCVRSGRTWRPVTPYLRPWHAKKRFGTEEQLRRECRLRGLPEIEDIRFLPEVMVGARPRLPVHFHRFRIKRGLVQPDTHGCFPELVFAGEVAGPLALGFSCHYGLGLFLPAGCELDHGE